jgi:prepilin-type N-terminal cleavage/methylation domain-containing protein
MKNTRLRAFTLIELLVVVTIIAIFENGDPIYNNQLPGLRFKSLASRHFTGAVLNFCDGHAAYYKDSYVTNGANFSAKLEGLAPDIIWNPAYRAFAGE